MLKFHLADHRGYINNQDETQTTAKTFQLTRTQLGSPEYYRFKEREKKC